MSPPRAAANGEQTGRTLGGTAYSLSYDYDGQLTQITQGQTTTDFAYDALGRRFSRTAGGTTAEFLYGAGGMVLEKQGGSYTQAYSQGNGLLRGGTGDGHGSGTSPDPTDQSERSPCLPRRRAAPAMPSRSAAGSNGVATAVCPCSRSTEIRLHMELPTEPDTRTTDIVEM